MRLAYDGADRLRPRRRSQLKTQGTLAGDIYAQYRLAACTAPCEPTHECHVLFAGEHDTWDVGTELGMERAAVIPRWKRRDVPSPTAKEYHDGK